jgi:hypothetical protein
MCWTPAAHQSPYSSRPQPAVHDTHIAPMHACTTTDPPASPQTRQHTTCTSDSQVLPQPLLARYKAFGPLATVAQTSPSFFDAPMGQVTAVFTYIDGMSELKVQLAVPAHVLLSSDDMLPAL